MVEGTTQLTTYSAGTIPDNHYMWRGLLTNCTEWSIFFDTSRAFVKKCFFVGTSGLFVRTPLQAKKYISIAWVSHLNSKIWQTFNKSNIKLYAGPSTSYHVIVVSKISPFFTIIFLSAIKLFTFLRTSLVVLQGIEMKSLCVFKLNQPQFVHCWSATMKSSYLIKI